MVKLLSSSLGVLVGANRRLCDGEPAGSLRLVCTSERVEGVPARRPAAGVPLYASVEQARAADEHQADGADG